MPTLNLLHRTTYRFSAPVELLPHRLQLRPREGRELRCAGAYWKRRSCTMSG